MWGGLKAFFIALAEGLGFLKDRQLIDAGKKEAQAEAANDALDRKELRDEIRSNPVDDPIDELRRNWSSNS